LVDEHDARLLDAQKRLALGGVGIDELLLLLVLQDLPRLAHADPARLLTRPEQPAERFPEVDVHLLLPAASEDPERREGVLGHLDLDRVLLQHTLAQLLAQLLARALERVLRLPLAPRRVSRPRRG